jgi:hypothetical protein
MKQVIFLSFYCQVYKKLPTARIYIHDRLIDEIEIPEYYTEDVVKLNKLYYHAKQFTLAERLAERSRNSFELTRRDLTQKEKKHPILDTYSKHMNTYSKEVNPSYFLFEEMPAEIKKIHPKIFVYVIDDEFLKSANGLLKIEIKNSDSNYNNGFLSSSTLLILDTFYIMPYTLFENPKEITQRYLDCYSRKTTGKDVDKLVKYYKNREFWPMNLNQYFMVKDKKGQESKATTIGGDVQLCISLKKKHNIWWAKEQIIKGFLDINHIFIKNFIVDFFNKYNCNEDQRSTG